MQNDRQDEFDWGESAENGYASWLWDRKEAMARIAEKWGLPLGRQVRLRRQGIDGDFEGRLELAALPPRMDRRLPLELRLGKMQFSSTEVEACSVVS